MSAFQRGGVLAIAVPATVNTYSDIFVGQPGPSSQAANNGGNTCLTALTAVLLAGFPAGVTIELWYLSPVPGVDPGVIGSYAFGQSLLTAAGAVTVPLASWPGLLIRAKSGGVAGTATLWITAD